ncbi:UPF0481 protein [Iris pallida]|uniref:UPF0481 protein n=1 Tax=Iris pallida TaxID=29817 RepID=A0AAX6EUN0_IRIPA|nr:UPF0481 protein [Iris pallida]
MVGVDGVEGLSNCEENEEDRCDQRDCRPGVPEVGVLKPRPPLVVGHAAVLHHVPEQLQVVVLLIVQVRAQAELVEDLRHLLVLAELALDDLRLLEQRDVLLRRDEAVHEHRVAREPRPAHRVGLLEGHQVAEVGEARLLYRQQRDLHHALLLVEDGVHEAHRPLLPPEPDPGLVELGGGGDASRRPLLLLGVVGSGGPAAAAHRRYLPGEDAGQHEEERRRGEAPAPLQLLDHHASEGRLAAPVRSRVEGRVVQMEQVVHGLGLRLVREVLHLLPRQVGDREVREINPGVKEGTGNSSRGGPGCPTRRTAAREPGRGSGSQAAAGPSGGAGCSSSRRRAPSCSGPCTPSRGTRRGRPRREPSSRETHRRPYGPARRSSSSLAGRRLR